MPVELSDIVLVIIGAILGLIIDIILPEKYRVIIEIQKRKLSKFIKNPEFRIGESLAIKIDNGQYLDDLDRKINTIFSGEKIEFKQNMWKFEQYADNSFFEITIIPFIDYENNDGEHLISKFTINVYVKSHYRTLMSHINSLMYRADDIGYAFEKKFYTKQTAKELFVEVKDFIEFSNFIENFNASTIKGQVKGSEIDFEITGKKLKVINFNSNDAMKWFKNCISFFA